MNRHAADSPVLYFHPIPDHLGIVQGFGAAPETYARAGMTGHNGIDFAAEVGTEVIAAMDGTVRHAGPGEDGPFGWLLGNAAGLAILLEHEVDGLRILTGYAHLSELLVGVGYEVMGGEPIAASGATGHVGGPHLHFELIPLGPKGEVWTGNGRLGRVDPTILTEPRD